MFSLQQRFPLLRRTQQDLEIAGVAIVADNGPRLLMGLLTVTELSGNVKIFRPSGSGVERERWFVFFPAVVDSRTTTPFTLQTDTTLGCSQRPGWWMGPLWARDVTGVPSNICLKVLHVFVVCEKSCPFFNFLDTIALNHYTLFSLVSFGLLLSIMDT